MASYNNLRVNHYLSIQGHGHQYIIVIAMHVTRLATDKGYELMASTVLYTL